MTLSFVFMSFSLVLYNYIYITVTALPIWFLLANLSDEWISPDEVAKDSTTDATDTALF